MIESNIEPKKKINVRLASHYGMCFGVRDAIEATESLARNRNGVTVLGQLVHNPVVDQRLNNLGVERGSLNQSDNSTKGNSVVITAHGTSDALRKRWNQAGLEVVDTTCPLVRKAHEALGALVSSGYHPVVIGRAGHVEVEGLVGDFPNATVIGSEPDIATIPEVEKLGVVSQTTQPIGKVREIVTQIEYARPDSQVKFVDTVCAPTKNRQEALIELCRECEIIVVVGGANSNNTGELVRTARNLGTKAVQVEGPEDIDPSWFEGISEIGVTAGTSTLEKTVRQVFDRLSSIS